MRIVIAADIFPPESGGPATYSLSLSNELTSLGHEVKIITLNPQADRSLVEGEIFIPPDRGKFFRYFWYTDRLTVLAKWADVVYAMGPVNAGLPAFIAITLRRKPLVVKVVGDYAWEQGVGRFGVLDGIDSFQKKNSFVWQVKLFKKIESFIVRKADRVVVPSEYLRKIVTGWGAEDEKVVTIYNSVKFLDVDRKQKPKNEKWLVFVGRLVAWKGVDTLCEIMPELLESDQEIRLKIIGDGPMMSVLCERIKKLNLKMSVDLLGTLSREEALKYVASADLLVLNTGYEGLSHVALEAMSYGVPVLASDMGGNHEIVISGKTGELFEYNNKRQIIDIILHSLLAPPVDSGWTESGVGKMFFDQFTFETMIENTVELLSEFAD